MRSAFRSASGLRTERRTREISFALRDSARNRCAAAIAGFPRPRRLVFSPINIAFYILRTTRACELSHIAVFSEVEARTLGLRQCETRASFMKKKDHRRGEGPAFLTNNKMQIKLKSNNGVVGFN